MWRSCFSWIRTQLISLILPLCLLVGGAGASVAFTPNLPPDNDAYQYEMLARSILEGRYSLDGVLPTMFREPGYPLIKAIFYFMGGTTRGFLWVQVFLVAITALLWWAAWRELRPQMAWIGSWGVLCAYGYWRFVSRGQYEVILGCWLALAIYLIIRFWKKPSFVWAIGSGVCFGALLLTRSVYQFLWLPAFWAGWYFFRNKTITKQTIAKTFIVFAISVLAFPLGWSMRNKALFDTYQLADRAGLVLVCRAILASTPWAGYVASAGSVLMGEQVIRSWFPEAKPFIDTHWVMAGDRLLLATNAAGGNIHQADGVLLEEAKQEILATPENMLRFLAWTPVELIRLFGLPSFEYPHSTMEPMFRGQTLPLSDLKIAIVLLVHMAQLGYLVFVVRGGWILWRERSPLFLFVLPVAYLFVIHAPLDNVVRFSAPVQPLLWMLVLYGIFHTERRLMLWQRIRAKRVLKV